MDKQETTPIFHAGIKYWKSMKILILNCRGAEASPSPFFGVDA